MRRFISLIVAALAALFIVSPAPAETADAGPPFGRLELVQEIDCAAVGPDAASEPAAGKTVSGDAEAGASAPAAAFREYPEGVSRIETVLGRRSRILPNAEGEAKFFAYRIGAGRNLKAGAAYLLAVEFPDDVPRSMFLCNWGCETARGVHTGTTVGDCLKARYTNNNPESLRVPQSGTWTTWRQLFWLHDRFPGIKRPRGREERPLEPKDGFWVIVAQPRAVNAPTSAGAAVARIRLFRVPEPARFAVSVRYPPDGLPRRHLFFREEMADGVVALGHKPEEKDPRLRGVTDAIDWFEYKARLARFLGMNVYAKDLLEFGHNQGWDSGGSAWYNASATPDRWRKILDRIRPYDLAVLPYYEYAGSIGQDKEKAVGSQRRCRRLDGGKDYTHIPWVHKTNADLADPAFIEDAKKLLECTIVRHKDRARFLGAWFRPRPEANPISFNDFDLARFAREAGDGKEVTREALQKDQGLLQAYYDWWYLKRRAWCAALRDYLRGEVNPQAFVLYTCDSSEPGASIPRRLAAGDQKEWWRWKTAVVTDDVPRWTRILDGIDAKGFNMLRPVAYDRAVREDLHLAALTTMRENWGNWEWHHAVPPADPQHYTDADGLMLSYTFNRLYTVSSPAAMEAFRTPAGLAMLRHYALNENEMHVGNEPLLGYFVADVERAGPYCMLAEARAVALGDPRTIGYLAGNSFTRGFPEVVRRFNAAFLALPALPSTVVDGAASEKAVVVRRIPAGEKGTWLAVVNTGLTAARDVRVALPDSGAEAGTVTNAATGQAVEVAGGAVTLSLAPGELVSLHLK